jgi:hypothetical protein
MIISGVAYAEGAEGWGMAGPSDTLRSPCGHPLPSAHGQTSDFRRQTVDVSQSKRSRLLSYEIPNIARGSHYGTRKAGIAKIKTILPFVIMVCMHP